MIRALILFCMVAFQLVQALGPASAEDFERINPRELRKSPYYSHAIVAPPGKAVFVAGQIAMDAQGNLIGKDDKAAQIRHAFKNLKIALEAAGAKPEHVVKIQVYSVDHTEADLTVIGEETRALWGDALPTSTLVPVPRLALDGLLFEIDADAVVP